ncbi:MAG: flavin reductase family protein [Parcubacteria group bacterium]
MKKIIEPKEPTITMFPYPVYLIACEHGDRKNITPVGWVSPVCNVPPLFGVSLRPGRYSYEIIRKVKKFSLNVPTEKILEESDFCGTFSGKEINKLEKTGLRFEYSSKNSPPIIEQCPVNIEFVLKKIINYGNHKHFVGEVQKILIDENLVDYKDFNQFFVAIGTRYYGLKEIGKCQDVYKKKFN